MSKVIDWGKIMSTVIKQHPGLTFREHSLIACKIFFEEVSELLKQNKDE